MVKATSEFHFPSPDNLLPEIERKLCLFYYLHFQFGGRGGGGKGGGGRKGGSAGKGTSAGPSFQRVVPKFLQQMEAAVHGERDRSHKRKNPEDIDDDEGDALPTFVEPEFAFETRERKKMEAKGVLDKLKVRGRQVSVCRPSNLRACSLPFRRVPWGFPAPRTHWQSCSRRIGHDSPSSVGSFLGMYSPWFDNCAGRTRPTTTESQSRPTN